MVSSAILDFEALTFVYGLSTILFWKLLTRKINLSGLLMDKSQPSRISPERVQLLLSTFAVGIQYLRESAVPHDGSLPALSPGWLYLMGGSSLVYSVRKVFERYGPNRTSK